MTTVADLLSATLLSPSDGGRSESELLLAAALNKNRAYLIAWPEAEVGEASAARYKQWVEERRRGTPIAYILGFQDFWSIKLAVSPDTLIPRPDTELLVERILELELPAEARLLDLGTGSGAIALALAKERPSWEIVATDVSSEALAVAEGNAQRLKISNVQFFLGSWFEALVEAPMNARPGAGNREESGKSYADKFDVIVSNPPYIDAEDPHLSKGDLRFEPTLALTPGTDGLLAYRSIARSAPAYLRSNGRLFFEHGYTQGAAVRELLSAYADVETYRDLAGHERATIAAWHGESTC